MIFLRLEVADIVARWAERDVQPADGPTFVVRLTANALLRVMNTFDIPEVDAELVPPRNALDLTHAVPRVSEGAPDGR